MKTRLSTYVKAKRKEYQLTQVELAEKAGVGLRLVREIEQGSLSLQMSKVNQVLSLFGAELGPVPSKKEDKE